MERGTNDREKRIAERRERALKRLQFASLGTAAAPTTQPTSCQNEKIEDGQQTEYFNEFNEIVKAFPRSLYGFKEENEATRPPSEYDGIVVADLCHLLREAAAQLDDQSNELTESFLKLQSVRNPMSLRLELHALAQQAATTEQAAAEVEATAASLLENKAAHFVKLLERQTETIQRAIRDVEKEFVAAAAAMAEHASTTEAALLQQLAKSHEARQATIAAEIEKTKLLELTLHEERVNKRRDQEKTLEEMRSKEHAGHDELWHDLSSQATELALELSLANHDQLFTADKLGYNVRVLGERNKENKEVLTELQKNLHKQKALLAGLRSQYAEEVSSTSAVQEKVNRDTEHALQSLNSIKNKALHFEMADDEELKQMVAFKEERLINLLKRLQQSHEKIYTICGSESLSSFGKIKLPTETAEAIQIDEALKEAHWREKFIGNIDQTLHQEFKTLETAIRQDL